MSKSSTQSGQYRERFAFDAPAYDERGNQDGWAEHCKRHAHLRWLRGGESVQAARLEGRQPVVITIKSSEVTRRITTDFRARDLRRSCQMDGETKPITLNIRSIVETEGRAYLEITAEYGVAI